MPASPPSPVRTNIISTRTRDPFTYPFALPARVPYRTSGRMNECLPDYSCEYEDFTSFSETPHGREDQQSAESMEAHWEEDRRTTWYLPSRPTAFCATWYVPLSEHCCDVGQHKYYTGTISPDHRIPEQVQMPEHLFRETLLFLCDIEYPDLLKR